MLIPAPNALGFPPKFKEWTGDQPRTISRILESNKRFILLNAPTGSGKSAIYMGVARMTPGRTCIVTKTKGLADQLMADFRSLGLTDIRGKSNYRCTGLMESTCEDGYVGKCTLKESVSCEYARHYFSALGGKLVVTNYANWILVHKYGRGLGKFDLLIFDEAHHLPEELAGAMQVRFTHNEISNILEMAPPVDVSNVQQWKDWGSTARRKAQGLVDYWKLKVDSTPNYRLSWLKAMNHCNNIVRRASTVATMNTADWVVETVDEGYQLDPVRTHMYGERILFLGAKKIIALSATIKKKSLFMCGVKNEDIEDIEVKSNFPPSRFPVIYIPAVKFDSKISREMVPVWAMAMDKIIGRRLDRKGIIHSISFRHRDLFMEHTMFADRIISHQQGTSAMKAVETFKSAGPGSVLISPSVQAGYDFPGDQCNYVIIAKVPLIDTRPNVTKARIKADKEYADYITVQAIQQMAGRGMRSADDMCEVFIIDTNFGWFWKRNGHLASRWFKDSLRQMEYSPDPLPLIMTSKQGA
jgi:ATP-dependent DNA helicase DinG